MLRSRSHGIISFYLLLSIFPPDASGFSQDVPIRALVRPLIRPPYTRIHLSFISKATPPQPTSGKTQPIRPACFNQHFSCLLSFTISILYKLHPCPSYFIRKKKAKPWDNWPIKRNQSIWRVLFFFSGTKSTKCTSHTQQRCQNIRIWR